MKAYPDASLIAAVVLREPASIALAKATGSADVVYFSDFCYGEVVSAIALHARRQNVDPATVDNLLGDLRGLVAGWQSISTQPADIARATDLVARVTLSLRLADAIHIAIAERIDATLVTTDRQQYRAAVALGIPAVNPIDEVTLA